MRRFTSVLALAALLTWTLAVRAEPEIDDDLRTAMDTLSAATLVDGAGWQTYEALLHPEYTRWAMGQVYEGREKFIRSLEEWWNYGMRVAQRDIDMVAADRAGNLVFVRFKTTEQFVGPDGPAAGFSGYVTNVWIKEDGRWLLLSAEISSAAE